MYGTPLLLMVPDKDFFTPLKGSNKEIQSPHLSLFWLLKFFPDP